MLFWKIIRFNCVILCGLDYIRWAVLDQTTRHESFSDFFISKLLTLDSLMIELYLHVGMHPRGAEGNVISTFLFYFSDPEEAAPLKPKLNPLSFSPSNTSSVCNTILYLEKASVLFV